jgi:hypothetical protein
LWKIARKNNGFQRRCNAKPIFESHVRILVPQLNFWTLARLGLTRRLIKRD